MNRDDEDWVMRFTTPRVHFCLHRFRARTPQLLIAAVILVAVLSLPLESEAQQAGLQWSKPIDITQPSGPDVHSWPVLLCDQYQNAYVLWPELSEESSAIFIRNDLKDSWSAPVDVIATPDPVIFGLNGAISNRDNTLHLIWMNRYLAGDLYYSQSMLLGSDNPKDWSTPLALAYGVDWATIGVSSEGIIHVLYGSTDESRLGHTVYHIKSSDRGKTWSDPVVAYTTASPAPGIIRPEIAIDGRDRIHVGISINSDEYGAYSEVGYTHSSDGGSTWGPYKQIQTMGTTFQGVAWITPYAFGTDEIHLTWHDPRRMHEWSLDGGNSWYGPEEIMPLGAGFGGRNQLVKDSAGILHVVVAVGYGVYSASRSSSQWNAPEQIDDRSIDPHGQVMIACQGNQLHIAYYDRTGDNKVWYSTRMVNAPHINREPIPTPTPLPANSINSAAGSISPSVQLNDMPAGRLKLADLNKTAVNPMSRNPLLQVLIPTLSVLVLIVGIFVLRRWRRVR